MLFTAFIHKSLLVYRTFKVAFTFTNCQRKSMFRVSEHLSKRVFCNNCNSFPVFCLELRIPSELACRLCGFSSSLKKKSNCIQSEVRAGQGICSPVTIDLFGNLWSRIMSDHKRLMQRSPILMNCRAEKIVCELEKNIIA